MLEALLWAAAVVLAGLSALSWLPFVHLRLSTIAPLVLPLFLAAMGGFGRGVLLALAVGKEKATAELRAAPRWVRAGWVGTFCYALLVGWFEMEAYRGQPMATSAGFFLKDHGKIVGTLTEAAYWQAARAEVRLFTAFALLFAFWGAAGGSYGSEPEQSRAD